VMIRLLPLVLNPSRVNRASHPKPRRTSMSKNGGVSQCAPACIQPGDAAASIYEGIGGPLLLSHMVHLGHC
jgi:hypothetical protein